MHCLPKAQYRKTIAEGGSIDYAIPYREGKGRTNIPDQVFVSPSEWARHDIRDPSFFRDVFANNFQSSVQKYREFENSPIVQERDKVFHVNDSILVSHRTGFTKGYRDDHIKVELDSFPTACPEEIQKVGRKGFFEGCITEISDDQSFLSDNPGTPHLKISCPSLKAGDVAAVVLPFVNNRFVGTPNILWAVVFRYWATDSGASSQILVKLRLVSPSVYQLDRQFSIYAIIFTDSSCSLITSKRAITLFAQFPAVEFIFFQ